MFDISSILILTTRSEKVSLNIYYMTSYVKIGLRVWIPISIIKCKVISMKYTAYASIILNSLIIHSAAVLRLFALDSSLLIQAKNSWANLGLTGGKYFIKIISDIKIEICIFKICVPSFTKFWVFLILEPIWA